MANPIELAEARFSLLARFVISLIMPAWALAMLVLGIEYSSPWWIGSGVVVGAIALLLFAGNPLAERIVGGTRPPPG